MWELIWCASGRFALTYEGRMLAVSVNLTWLGELLFRLRGY